MTYTYKYARPSLTVDCVIFGNGEEPKVLLIKRGAEPYKGQWANPGGFVEVSDDDDQGEDLEDAARRELFEETGIKVGTMEQIGTFGSPKRDPRGRVITVAYMAVVDQKDHVVEAGDDASDARWFTLEEADRINLAFDHRKILDAAIRRLQAIHTNDEE